MRKEAAEARWKYQHSVLALLGQIAVTWAIVEAMIDALIAWYHPINGASIRPDLPVTFERKMEYLNVMARDPGFVAEDAKALRRIRTDAKRFSKLRKALIHGILLHRNPLGTEWEVQLRRFEGATSVVQRMATSDADLRAILSQMAEFSHAISPWIGEMTGLAKKARTSISSTKSE